MEKRTRTWITIILSVIGVMMILAVAAIGGTAFWVFQHIHSEKIAEETAGDSFARARQRFAGQQPLIEIQGRDQVIVHRSDAPVASESAKLRTLRAMIYDPDDGRLVDVNVPFWVLRLAPSGGRFSFLDDRDLSIDSDRVRLTLEDLERHGPGLIIDHHDQQGSIVLVWTE